MLLPQDPAECFEHAAAALDLADRLQTPVFVMTDLDIGMNQRLCEPLRVGRRPPLRPRQGDDRRGARGRQGLRPLQGRRRRRHPVAHAAAARTRPRARTSRAAPRATPMPRYSEAGPDYIYNVQRLLKKFDTAASAGAAAAWCARRRRRPRLGVIYFGSTAPAMDEALDALAGERHPPRRDAAARLPVPRQRARVHRHARPGVRGRAEPRRADAHAADQRARDRSRRG